MKKRLLSFALAMLLTASFFTACASKSGSGSTAATPSSTGSGSAAANDPITITVLNRVNPEVNFDNNPMLDAIEEKTGVRLEIEAPPISNYTDRLQIVMASGDLPDIVYTWEMDQNYEKWAADGLLWELDDRIENYPNLMHNITEGMWTRAKTSTTGKIHAVPRPHIPAQWGVIANQEWLDKLGVEMPTTLDELYEYGKLVATQDPDGNGKDDTFLFSPYNLWSDCWLVFAFLPFSIEKSIVSYLPDTDGEYKVRENMSGYWPYLDFMRKLYAEKIIDQEFFTNNYYDDKVKFTQNRVAMYHGGATSITDLESKGELANATEICTFHPAMLGEGQTKPRNEAAAATWGGWMINADVEEEKLDRILEFLDWANSEEGFVTIAAGVQGIDYESYDLSTRMLVVTPEQQEAKNSHVSGYLNFANAYEGLGLAPADTPERIDYAMDVINNFEAAVDQIDIPSVKSPKADNWPADNPDIQTKKTELEIKYVVGEIEKEDLQAYLDDTYFPSVEEAETEYKEVMAAYKG